MSRNASLMLTSTMQVLRAQRPYVSQRRSYERAFQQGRRSWQGYYGEQLIEQIAEQARHPRRWVQVGAMVAVLARYYPRGLAARLARTLLQRNDRPRPRSGRQSPDVDEVPRRRADSKRRQPSRTREVAEPDVGL